MIFINNLSPILFAVGPVEVRWYGLFFAMGCLLNYLILMWIFKREGYELKTLENLCVHLFIGLVLGARLGEVFFYEPGYYFGHPLEILKIWHGGLSSHGAAIGLFLAYVFWCFKNKVKFSKYVDAIIIPMPLTAAFVRVGNFFNSEIVGKATGSDYGVIFRRLGEDFPRHPAMLYEGLMSFMVFLILVIVYKKYFYKLPEMFMLFLYLLLYFGGRMITEIWKDLHVLPDSFPLSMGQVLSLVPFTLAVVYFLVYFSRKGRRV